MVFVETSFPRGGVAKQTNETDASKPDIEFGATTTKRHKEKLNKKQRIDKRINENEEHAEKLEAISAELLNLRTINEGMTIMGCIKKIDPTFLLVALPGRLTGKVLVTATSQSYVNILSKFVNDEENVVGFKNLEDMYRIGQIVCCKVMQIEQDENNQASIILSMQPKDIQSHFQHTKVQKGAILCVAIENIEDHGYVIETGIANLRGFMPTENVNNNVVGVGEVIFCKVEQTKIQNIASTIIVKLVTEAERVLKMSAEPNLAYMLPSTIVKFKITKVLKDGLQGSIMQDTFNGYINEHQLSSPSSVPEDYEVDDVLDARVLYVMPITKLIYLSLNLSEVITMAIDGSAKFKVGAIVDNAKVIRIGTGGLIMKLDAKNKGLISFKSLRIGYQSNYDEDTLMSKFHKNSRHKVRVIGYDAMDSLYICSNNEQIINEKHYVINDVEIGDYVDAKIVHSLADGGYCVRVGNIKGYIEKIQLATSTPASRFETDAKLRCRVLRKNEKNAQIFLTNRKELMVEQALLLKSYEKAVIGLEYLGMIVKIYTDGYLVSFCNYVKGMLYKKNMNELDANTASFFTVGQIMKFRIMHVKEDNHITLGLGDFVCQTGTALQGRITTVDSAGLNIVFPNSKFNGFVPSMFLSNFPSLVPKLHEAYRANEAVEAVCISQNVYSIRDLERIKIDNIINWSDLKVGDIVPAFVKNVSGQIIDLLCFVENHNKIIKIHAKMLLEDYTKETKINLVAEQLLYVRVLGKNKMLHSLTCSAKLSHVWNGDLKETARILQGYFRDYKRIQNFATKSQNPLASFSIGDKIEATVVSTDAGQIIVQTNDRYAVTGLVHQKPKASLPNNGKKLKCIVAWVDYNENQLHLSSDCKFLERNKDKDLPKKPTVLLNNSRGVKADVICVLEHFIVLYPRKLTNKFIYVPTRLHYNDLQPIITNDVHVGDLLNVSTIDSNGEFYVGMFENIYSMFYKLKDIHKERKEERKPESADEEEDDINDSIANDNDDGLYFTDKVGKINGETSVVNSKNTVKKRSTTNAGAGPSSKRLKHQKIDQLDGSSKYCEFSASSGSDDDDEEYMPLQPPQLPNLAVKRRNVDATTSQKRGKLENPKDIIKLPGAADFWTSDLRAIKGSNADVANSSSEDDDEAPSTSQARSVKKLTSAEKFTLARQEEARVRQIEENNANPDAVPTTVDQFERQVMGTPDSSLAWINYMVFHMQSNELQKARVVARNAFKKISYRKPQELLNVWIALLNLELRYGNKDTFDEAFNEAVTVNDPFKIYMKTIQMLKDVDKVEDLSILLVTFLVKFRAYPDAWITAAITYFELDMADKAKPLLNRALTALPDRHHVNTIIKFAHLNNKCEQKDTAHALMEQVLMSYPKRIDCWTQYVDMLIKDEKIEVARQVLDRSVSHRMPLKKMRVLFKKYLDFEEKHGNAEKVQKVKAMATSYIENELRK